MTDQPRSRRYSIGLAIDWFFFVFAGVAAVWLAYLSLTETFHVGWWGVVFVLAFWVLLAYLVLPRRIAFSRRSTFRTTSSGAPVRATGCSATR